MLQNHKMTAEFETLVHEEWLQGPASIAFAAALEAYNETERVISENPILRHRNEANLRGQLRYFITAAILDQCACEGRLRGITSRWEPLGCDVLVLSSRTFEVQVAHTSGPDQKPRSSLRREMAIISNQTHFDSIWSEGRTSGPELSDLISLFLLHGDKQLSFMNLVCPDNLQRGAPYIYTSPNFATLPRPVAKDDVETVREAVPRIAAELIERLRSAEQ